MTITLSVADLASRGVRSLATGGRGVRTIATRAAKNETSEGGSINSLFGSALAFGASIVKKAFELILGGIVLSITALFSAFIRLVGFVWNFNWNTTDTALNAQLQAAYVQLAGSLGGTLGSAIGYLVCGVGGAALISTVNESLALTVFKELGEEALDEIAGNLAELIKITTKVIFQTWFTYIFKNVRSIFRSDGAKLRDKLIESGKITPEQMTELKAERDKPWSFAIGFNNFIESVPGGEIAQEFLEEFFDEFSGSCVESGYIIAQTLDTAFPDLFNGINAVLANSSTVTIVP